MTFARQLRAAHSTNMKAIVYAGKHYGKCHDVIAREGRSLTVKHSAGDMFTVNLCDAELDELIATAPPALPEDMAALEKLGNPFLADNKS